MKHRHNVILIPAALLLIMGSLVTGAQPGRAAGQQPTKFAIAQSVGVSETTGHVFVASMYIGDPKDSDYGKSWVTMLDARTSKVLKVVPVAPGALHVLVNDRTQRAFVVHGGYAPDSADSVTTLDTRTGKILARTPCGQGSLMGPALAIKSARLFFVINGPRGFVLHELDATTGKHLRQVTLSTNTPGISVAEQAGLLFVKGPSPVQVYDMRSLKRVALLPVQLGSPLVVPDEPHHRVLVIAGQGFQTLNVFDMRTWKRVATVPTSNGTVSGIAFEQNMVFLLNGGTSRGQTPTSDGSVRVMDRTTYRVVRTLSVGTNAGQVLADARTHHLFVLSGPHLKSMGTTAGVPMLTTINTRTNSRLSESRIQVGSPLTMSLDGQHGLLFIVVNGASLELANASHLITVNAGTGGIVRNVALPLSSNK